MDEEADKEATDRIVRAEAKSRVNKDDVAKELANAKKIQAEELAKQDGGHHK